MKLKSKIQIGDEKFVIIYKSKDDYYWAKIKILQIPSSSNLNGEYTVLVKKVKPKVGDSHINIEGQVITLDRKTVQSPVYW